MYKDIQRTCTAIVLLIKPVSVVWRSRCRSPRGLLKLSNKTYNIASRAAQSNSVYVGVLKIPIVHADSVSKSLRQNFCFFARATIVSAGENIIQ